MKTFSVILACCVLAAVVLQADAGKKRSNKSSGDGNPIVGFIKSFLGDTCFDWCENKMCNGQCNILSMLGLPNKIPGLISEIQTCNECKEARETMMSKLGGFKDLFSIKM